ncbi:hypothetical protein RFI_32161 [Reticulomyxa filosa]|uniref:Uncharacterized protein n=1 Tax=Reticulomyxa filosa TaxID=46433 RepID=X6LWX0_RETFI|nr:hypothetical protein RFI_32161 [Reticulomyxa filosa]|eukprot:ETO05235.1 hypothetical protein RFI_32161 [Reticulomyxa filosa]
MNTIKTKEIKEDDAEGVSKTESQAHYGHNKTTPTNGEDANGCNNMEGGNEPCYEPSPNFLEHVAEMTDEKTIAKIQEQYQLSKREVLTPNGHNKTSCHKEKHMGRTQFEYDKSFQSITTVPTPPKLDPAWQYAFLFLFWLKDMTIVPHLTKRIHKKNNYFKKKAFILCFFQICNSFIKTSLFFLRILYFFLPK